MTREQTTELTPLEPVDLVDLVEDDRPRDDRSSASRPRRRPRTRRILRIAMLASAVALVLLLLGAVVGPYVYIHFIEGDPPKPLSFAATDSKTASAPTTDGVAGAWTVTGGSTVGYRVSETLFGQGNTAVGRTPVVTGDLTIMRTSVRSATFTVDVASISSDSSGRDGSYRKLIDTARFPTATFTLTKPIVLAMIPADLQQIALPVTGNLTLHGVTQRVTFGLKARRNGGRIEVNGTIPIAFANYKIANPSIPGIKVGNAGKLEFLIVFTRR